MYYFVTIIVGALLFGSLAEAETETYQPTLLRSYDQEQNRHNGQYHEFKEETPAIIVNNEQPRVTAINNEQPRIVVKNEYEVTTVPPPVTYGTIKVKETPVAFTENPVNAYYPSYSEHPVYISPNNYNREYSDQTGHDDPIETTTIPLIITETNDDTMVLEVPEVITTTEHMIHHVEIPCSDEDVMEILLKNSGIPVYSQWSKYCLMFCGVLLLWL